MYLYVKLNRDANHFLPAERKDCMDSDSRNISEAKLDGVINQRSYTFNKGLFRVKMHSLLLRPGSDNSISL